MSPLACCFLALAAAALLHGASTEPRQLGNSQCTTITKGHEVGVERILDDIVIKAGERITNVPIERVCIDNINLAEIATACDDVAPIVHLINWPQGQHWPPNTTVVVTRQGDYLHRDTILKVTLWCPH